MASVRKTIVSNCEKKFLIKNLSEWTRLDGRAFDEFRKIHIEFGKDYGCCYTSLGKTKVLAQVSCEIQQPKSSRPSEGILNINIELNTIAAPHFESGRQSDLSVQLNRLLEKCLKDSKAVDLESLCIKMNEKVWALRLDINVLNHEGNILDCASIAGLAALAHFRKPDVTCDGEEFVIHSYKQRDPIPMVIHHYPVCVTYSVFNGGEYILADPTLLEENVADAFLSAGLNSYKELCGLHLGGKADLSVDVILNTVNKAAARADIVVQLIKDAVEEDNTKRQDKIELGFHKSVEDESEKETVEQLSFCLDQWSVKGKKSKKKKESKVSGDDSVVFVEEKVEEHTTRISKDEDILVVEEDIKSNTYIADVKAVGLGSAVLVPQETSNGNTAAWQTSDSEDDDAVMVVETPQPVVDTVDILDSDSEEDVVVILNADRKTNKKKKKKKIKT